MSDEMRNAMFPGLQGIDLETKQKSHLMFPVNGPLGVVGQIVAYDATTGRGQVEAIWDEGLPKARLNVQFVYNANPGIPTADEIKVGSFTVAHRVGEFNSAGTGIPAGFELRQQNNQKVSWVCFFF